MNTSARNARATVAAETLKIIERGRYVLPDGKEVELAASIAASVAATKLYRDTPPLGENAGTLFPTRISVTPETTSEAIARLSREGQGIVGALNFASARNPGGGFLGGAQAQEEAITRASALYPCLLKQPEYYERNRANRSALYLDLAIFSPDVAFFRDDSGKLLGSPVFASVITAPAPNAGAVRANEPANEDKLVPALRRRAALVLAIAKVEGITRLILGAWGCGVFRNEPATVARIFHEHLSLGGAFHGAFQNVVFAIYDPTPGQATLAAFQVRFGASGEGVLGPKS